MALNQGARQLRAAVVKYVSATGVCATVNGAEVGRARGRSRGDNKPHAMVVLGPGQAAPEHSTLDSTAWRQAVLIRLEAPLPLGDHRAEARLEDTFADAVTTIIDRFHTEIDVLDDDTIEFDPEGAAGLLLGVNPGYVDNDGTKMRVADLSLPFVMWDLWNQAR